MRTIGEGAFQLETTMRDTLRARYPTLCPTPLPQQLPIPFDRSAIVVGRNQGGAPVLLSERARLEHMHVIGTTGGGKSKFIEVCVRQDVSEGRGVCVVDPHGEHPDSLYRSILAWLDERGYTKTRTIHLIDPNAPTHTIGFNPLARPDGDTDLSVIAGVMLEAFSRAWGGEDTTHKPTIERVLTATFAALAELNLTLAEAPLLYDRPDRHGLRAWAIQHIHDRYAREELQRLHELSLDERRRHDFDLEVIGPINRIARFVRPTAIRTMIGQTDRVLDIREALDEGHIILVNLSGGSRVYERDADLLGRLLTRSLFFHAKRRRAPERPFFVYLDECHRYLSGDLENLLAESRKYGIGMVLSHQWLAQATVESENMLAALRNATNVKVVFRLKDPVEAEDLGHMVVPLDLEMPVERLVKPTVVGHRLVKLGSESASAEQSTTRMASKTDGTSESTSYTTTESYAETVADGESWSESQASSAAQGNSNMSAASSMTGNNTALSYLPSPGGLGPSIFVGMTQGNNMGSNDALGRGTSSASGSSSGAARGGNSMRAVTTGRAHSESVSHGRNHATSTGKGTTVGTSKTRGSHEAFEPLMANLPASVHSKENALYMAAQTLRTLKTGTAYINFIDRKGMHAAIVAVPNVQGCALLTEAFATLREQVLARSTSATPLVQACEHVNARERALIARARIGDAHSEPETTAEFRTKKKRPEKRAPKAG
jgi:DNA helicase HerA-like ATPase